MISWVTPGGSLPSSSARAASPRSTMPRSKASLAFRWRSSSAPGSPGGSFLSLSSSVITFGPYASRDGTQPAIEQDAGQRQALRGRHQPVRLEGVWMDDPDLRLAGAADIDMTALQKVFDKSAGGVLAVRRRD